MFRPGVGCALCGSRSRPISAALGVCGSCIRARPEEALARTSKAHADSRRAFRLPEAPPRTEGGVSCPLCARACRIGDGQRGYCGLRTARRGLLHWYRDPLPTNCVADWVCAGSGRLGCHNLAVFYTSCSANCLFCQNWEFRETSVEGPTGLSAADLAAAANRSTFCVCFFGGDPSSQPTLVAASTLLVPGYVDAEEVHRIARFVAERDPETPYALLAFAPHFLMRDLPCTSLTHAEEAVAAARDAGLRIVRLGNRHLLSRDY